jgi:small subunit ribosomal protein S7
MRGKAAPKRKILPDPRYNDAQISKFINYVMRDGKKSVARSIVYQAFDMIEEKTKKNPLEVFELAMKNVAPTLEVKGRRIGGANYQIPVQVRADRRFVLASRWLIEAAAARKGKAMFFKLAQELMDAANKEGAAMKKRETVQKMAEANRAFAHFAR